MFITFEGPDGSGKSTQAKLLADFLRSMGKKVLLTREPGGCQLGEKLRELLLDNKKIKIDPQAELFLFCADRAQHLAEVIRPALARGEVVICDRYIDSTFAYQAGGRQFPAEIIDLITEFNIKGLVPELTFLIDVPVEVGRSRLQAKGYDKFESEATAFQERVRESYLDLAQRESRIVLLDGTATREAIFAKIQAEITRKVY